MKVVFFFDRDDTGPGRPSVEQLVKEARQLALLSYPRAAAVIARAALELSLAEACKAHDCWPAKPGTGEKFKLVRGIETFMASLGLKRRINDELRRRVLYASTIGNRAAHAKPVRMSDAYVILECVREMRSFLQAAEQPSG
jgi:hypothetical protein